MKGSLCCSGLFDLKPVRLSARSSYVAFTYEIEHQAAGKSVQLLVGEGYNHFEIPETLANPHGLLGRAVLAQMNLQ